MGADSTTPFEVTVAVPKEDGSVQVVEHSATTVTYPVVADPWLGKALVSKTKWDGDTLRVYPTDWAVCKH